MEKLEQLAQAVSSSFNQKIEIRKCHNYRTAGFICEVLIFAKFVRCLRARKF